MSRRAITSRQQTYQPEQDALIQQTPGDEIMAEGLVKKAETILVVNDKALSLQLAVATLNTANFLVLHADSEANGLKVAANYARRIDLLLPDSQMPSLSNRSLTETLKQTWPDISVTLTCGDILISSYGCALIHDPFVPVKLLKMINAVLHPADELHSVRQSRTGSGA